MQQTMIKIKNTSSTKKIPTTCAQRIQPEVHSVFSHGNKKKDPIPARISSKEKLNKYKGSLLKKIPFWYFFSCILYFLNQSVYIITMEYKKAKILLTSRSPTINKLKYHAFISKQIGYTFSNSLGHLLVQL